MKQYLTTCQYSGKTISPMNRSTSWTNSSKISITITPKPKEIGISILRRKPKLRTAIRCLSLLTKTTGGDNLLTIWVLTTASNRLSTRSSLWLSKPSSRLKNDHILIYLRNFPFCFQWQHKNMPAIKLLAQSRIFFTLWSRNFLWGIGATTARNTLLLRQMSVTVQFVSLAQSSWSKRMIPQPLQSIRYLIPSKMSGNHLKATQTVLLHRLVVNKDINGLLFHGTQALCWILRWM